jgi:hypothetical protein
VPDNFTKNSKRILIADTRLVPSPNGGSPDFAYFSVTIEEPVPSSLGAQLSAAELSAWLLNHEPEPGKKWTKLRSTARLREVYELVKLSAALFWAIDPARLPTGPVDPFTNSSNRKRLVLGARAGTPTGGDDTFDHFVCVVEPDPLDANAPSVDDLKEQLKSTSAGKIRNKPLGPTEEQKEFELVLLDGALFWRRPAPLPPGYDNPTRDWLFYEAIFNHEKFQKQNQKIEMGSYLIPFDAVKIFVCQGIDPAALKVLTEAFLPDLDPEEVVARAALDCPWKAAAAVSSPLSSASPQTVSGSRAKVCVRTGLQIAMPFNFQDAGGEIADFAIGGATTSHLGAALEHLVFTWPMWKSASRSCVCQLEPIKAQGANWPARRNPQAWTVHSGETNIKNLKDLAQGTDYFKLGDDKEKKCFSVKTGVNFVGKVNQTGDNAGGKNRLETNSIDACLRSDLVTQFDQAAGHTQSADPHLLVLKELLSITEFDRRRPLELGDGMQVRDLSVLDRAKKYICPISIMYLDRAMTSMTNRYRNVASQTWVDFWRDTYAIPLGRAKALLLLRYAMQMGSPNAQNYLIEFKNGSSGNLDPTGRIVTRDLGDAQIHREVMWAIHGPEGVEPPVGGHPSTIGGAEDLQRIVIEEEKRKLARRLEPLMVEICETLEKDRNYPPLSVGRKAPRDVPAALEQHFDTYIANTLRLKGDKELSLVLPKVQERLGKHPKPERITYDVVIDAINSANIKPDGVQMRSLIDGRVAGDITTAQKTIARDVESPPVKYEFGVLREIKSYVMESGAVDPGRAYGEYSGVQLRWTMFSALTRGSNVSTNTASTDQGIRDPGWQRVLEVNSYWGQHHNRTFVRTIESCLGLLIPVPWGDAYDAPRYHTDGPGRYARLTAEQYERAGKYYLDDVKWEHLGSSVIQRVLASPEGQAAIRAYHRRRWLAAGA